MDGELYRGRGRRRRGKDPSESPEVEYVAAVGSPIISLPVRDLAVGDMFVGEKPESGKAGIQGSDE